MFQLTDSELYNLKCQIGTSSLNGYGGRRTLPFVFTEMGVTALAGILRSASINRIGFKTFSINLIEDEEICDMLIKRLSIIDGGLV